MEQYYYSSVTGQTYSAYQMQGLFGINVETTDISILNLNGFYPVQSSTPNFDLKLYNASSTWVIVPITPSGEGAQLDFTPVAKPLPEAKENAAVILKEEGDTATAELLGERSLTSDVMSAVASQDLIDRPAPLQVVLDEMVVITDALGAQLDAIDAATTVDEINNIVNPPTGTIYTGRGGSGGGPLDMNPSTMTDWNSVSMDVTDTELYIPATMTTVLYNGALTPYTYAQTFGAFTPGNYTVQLRQTSTSLVIAEWECPDEAVNVPINF